MSLVHHAVVRKLKPRRVEPVQPFHSPYPDGAIIPFQESEHSVTAQAVRVGAIMPEMFEGILTADKPVKAMLIHTDPERSLFILDQAGDNVACDAFRVVRMMLIPVKRLELA